MGKLCDKILKPEDATVGMAVGEGLNSLSIVMYLVMCLRMYLRLAQCSFCSQYIILLKLKGM